MYLSAPEICITQRAARSIMDKPICITGRNKVELLWKQIFQQNFSDVNGLQLCSPSPWGTYLLFSAIRNSLGESLRSMTSGTPEAQNSNNLCFPWGISFWYQHPQRHSPQTPHQTWDGFTAMTSSA